MNIEIKELPIGEIKSNPKNPRFIKDDKYKSLLKSLKDFPEMKSIREIVIDEDYIILGGNMRYKAIKESGEKTALVKIISGLTEKQKQEFIVKDNQPYGSWDMDLLANDFELDDLLEWGFDEADLDIDKFKDEIDEEKLDEVPEVQKDAISKLGDLFVIDGKHRVMCGDSTKEADVGDLCANVKVDMYLSDPPYNVDYTGKTKDSLKIQNDKKKNNDFRAFLILAFKAADENMKGGSVFYIWHADLEGYNFRGACFDIGWQVRQCLIWNKNSMVMGRQDYHWKHEPCLYGWKDGSAHLWAADRKQTTVIDFQRPNRNAEHPTMKPVGLMEYQIQNNTKHDDIVLDTFLGSGSTLIASQQTNRICYGMELDPIYIDVILRRYKNLYPNAKIECLNREFNFEELWQKEEDLKS